MWVPVAVWQPCELLYTCYLRSTFTVAHLSTVAHLFFFRTDSMDSPDCLPILLSISLFTLVFLLCSLRGFRAHVKIASRIVSYRTRKAFGFYRSKRQWMAVASAGPLCKSAPRSRQTTTPAPHHSVFYRPDALPAALSTASKHWRHLYFP